MPTEPLQPFGLPGGMSIHLSAGSVIGWALFLVFVLWAVYTLAACYHWVRYAHAPAVAFPAIITHLAVSALIMTFALSGAFLP